MANSRDNNKAILGKIAFGVVIFLVWLFVSASFLSYTPRDLSGDFVYQETNRTENLLGLPGAWCAYAVAVCFGVGGYFFIFAFGVGVLLYWTCKRIPELWFKTLGAFLLLIAVSGFSAYFFERTSASPIGPGGCVGSLAKYLLDCVFVRLGAYLALTGIFCAGLSLVLPVVALRFLFWSTGLGGVATRLVYPFRRKLKEARPKRFELTSVSVFQPPRANVASNVAPNGVPEQLTPSPTAHVQTPTFAPRVASYSPRPTNDVRPVSSNDARLVPSPTEQTRPSPASVVSSYASVVPAPNAASPNVLSNGSNRDERAVEVNAADFASAQPPVAAPKRSLFSQAFGFGAKKPDPSVMNEVLTAPAPTPSNAPSIVQTTPTTPTTSDALGADAQEDQEKNERFDDYVYPPIDLLEPGEFYDYAAFHEQIVERGAELERVCRSYGVELKVVDVQTGPVLTLYEIELKEGLRVKTLHSLTNDLEIAMRAPHVRIVSPIPGKNTVGIELPNQVRQTVRLREVLETCAQDAEKMAIPIFLGKDVVGAPMIADLAKLPHLLIAGRTGTGKSVCLNSIIMSILMTRSPKQVKLIMIDPKMVELSPYKTIPHLMHPVVVDMEKAEAILEWAVEKMESRYKIFARVGARQLSEFNKMPLETMRKRLRPRDEEEWASFPKSMPSVVIIADEMADLIMTSGKEVERHIVRLAQKSRAVGIHLVLATQKPTVDVVTGLIKSNLPARISFAVASRTDSQVVLDSKGAEQLLGNGDMLFLLPGTSQIVRGQGAFVSDHEIDSVIDTISVEEPSYEVVIEDKPAEDAEESETRETEFDEYYIPAVDFVIGEGRASTSLLQRKFSIGYSRASRIIDMMASEGIISAFNPAKPSRARDILITMEQWRGKQPDPEPQSSNERRSNFTVVDVAPEANYANETKTSSQETSPYRATSYEKTPVSTPETRAQASKDAVSASYREFKMARDEQTRSYDEPDETNVQVGSEVANSGDDSGWDAEKWEKYLSLE